MPELQLFVLHGADEFSAREELRRLRAALDVDGNLAHNTIRFDARAGPVKVDEVIAACQTASFFAEPRLVIADGLLERLGGGTRRRARTRTRRTSGQTQASDTERLFDALGSLPPTTTVVLLEASPSKAMLEALPDGASVREFAPLRRDALQSWAARRAEERGARLTPAAIGRLCDLLDGYHLGEMAQEIEKLASYAGSRPIEVADVDELVSLALHYQTWDLTDMAIAGRADRALQVLQRMDEKSFPPQLLFAVLKSQYRQILLAKSMQDEGMPEAEIGRRLGITHPFPLRKLMEQTGRYSGERLDDAYRRFLQADFSVKTGVLDVQPALEMLIVELSTLTSASRGSANAGRR